MRKLGRSTYSKIPKQDLEKRLSQRGKRLILSDIDGTLPNGLWGRYGGISYLNIACALLPQLCLTPSAFGRFSKKLVKIFFSELIHHDEEKHIEDFVNGLYGIPLEQVRIACQKTATKISPFALAFLKRCRTPQTELYLVGKTLEPMAEEYAFYLAKELSIPVSACFNSLVVDKGKITGLEKKVVTAEHKVAYASSVIAASQPQQIIALGDSKEDAPFFSLPYPESSLRIAIHPKDEIIKEASDIWSWSWKELHDIFWGIPQPSRGKKWFFMGIVGAGALVYVQETKYYNAVAKESGKMCSDWMTQRPAKKERMLLVDLHAHVNATTSAAEIIAETPKDVDVIALADKSERDTSFFDLKGKLEKEKILFIDKGYLLEVPRKEKPLYVAYAQEKSYHGFHILSIGHHSSILQENDPIQSAREQGGFIILAHPYTVENKTLPWLMPYWFYPENAPLPYHDTLEAFNAQNMFFMIASNVRAQRACERENLPGVAGSDTHGVIEDIGISGNYFHQGSLDFSTDKAFYSSLRKAITEHQFERREHYASPITFVKTIATGHLQWYHLVLFFGGAGCGYWVMKKR